MCEALRVGLFNPRRDLDLGEGRPLLGFDRLDHWRRRLITFLRCGRELKRRAE
jgi:hypothetical protein